LFLVLLRIAIGWHFLYEGTQKILSTPWGKTSVLARIFPVPEGPVFTSEGYLRAATGPVAPRFRALVPDVDSREKLKPENIKAALIAESKQVEAFYGFDAAQKDQAAKLLDKSLTDVDEWFKSTENVEKVKKYLDELAEIEAVEANPHALSYERSNAWADRKVAETDRKELVKTVDSWTEAVRDSLVAIAKKDAKRFEVAGPYKPVAPWSTLAVVDLLTMWGLSAVGFCLIVGLFTPLAALGAAGYLIGFYLSMPPWPGLPEGVTEGHYRYVNKNLIEMIACLVLASTPNGLWIGFDALLFGRMGQKRRLQAQAEAEAEAERTSNQRPEPQDRRKFKTR
jgi:uncharacterized membrane protein YphA (DoxX/SURF4 family)